jgi:hypothetical protein
MVVSSSGTAISGVISGGFTAFGGGFYLWHTDLLPDGHRGAVLFWSTATSGNLLSMASINPQEGGVGVTLQSGSLTPTSFSSGTATAYIPDNILTRDYSYLSGNVVSGVIGRCLLNATRKLVNMFSLTTTSGYLDVFQENDSTLAYRQAVGFTSGAPPITSMDTQ